MPVSSLLLTPHHCGVMSSPAARRIAAAKSKVSETRPVVGRVSLGPPADPPGRDGDRSQAAEGLSPPRVSRCDSECDDFSFRLTMQSRILSVPISNIKNEVRN